MRSKNQIEPVLKCRKCGKPIEKFKNEAEQIFEGMHWHCFHFEFEHEGEPDQPCAVDFSCPNLKIAIYETFIKKHGIDPQKILEEEMKKAWDSGDKADSP